MGTTRPQASPDMVEQSGIALRTLLNDLSRSYNYPDIDVLEGERRFSRANTRPDVSGIFSLRIRLHMPLVTAPMPDATDAHIATVAARNGGLGIIPPTPDPQEAVEMVRKVKLVESGFKENPFTLAPSDLVERALTAPYSNIPIMDNGKIVGMLYSVQYSNYYFPRHAQEPISRVMEKDMGAIIAQLKDVQRRGALDFERAKEIMIARNVPALAVVGNAGELLYLVTMKDVKLREEHAQATRDHEGRLMVGAAVFEYLNEDNLRRIRMLVDAGANPIVIDQAHGWNVDMSALCEYLKREYPHIDIVCGNDSAGQAAVMHWNSGADGWKIGNGPGQACETGSENNVGIWRPQFSAVYDCAEAMHALAQKLKQDPLPCCADGGIRGAYDAFKGLCAGASTFMVGTWAARCEDSPAEDTGRGTKIFRAMGSPDLAKKNAMAAGRYDPKTFVAEGRTNEVPKAGTFQSQIDDMRAKLAREFERVGARNQQELHAMLRNGTIRAQFAHNRQTR